MRAVRRLARDERGSVLGMFAVAIPTFILFLAMALDIGNWYTHKRKLQNRVDDAAFAAALEYGYRFPDCTDDTPLGNALEAQVKDVTLRFAGDESLTAPPAIHNTGVNQ